MGAGPVFIFVPGASVCAQSPSTIRLKHSKYVRLGSFMRSATSLGRAGDQTACVPQRRGGHRDGEGHLPLPCAGLRGRRQRQMASVLAGCGFALARVAPARTHRGMPPSVGMGVARAPRRRWRANGGVPHQGSLRVTGAHGVKQRRLSARSARPDFRRRAAHGMTVCRRRSRACRAGNWQTACAGIRCHSGGACAAGGPALRSSRRRGRILAERRIHRDARSLAVGLSTSERIRCCCCCDHTRRARLVGVAQQPMLCKGGVPDSPLCEGRSAERSVSVATTGVGNTWPFACMLLGIMVPVAEEPGSTTDASDLLVGIVVGFGFRS